MDPFYEVPGGTNWVKANLKVIIGNEDLAKVMNFGDLWRSRGHTPIVHVVSAAMDGGKMWEQHKDPSGLLDNIPSHIDLFIVDFYNLENPEIPQTWRQMKSPPVWLLWEYKAGKVRFNGTKEQFIRTFKIDPSATPATPPTGGGTPAPIDTTSGGLVHVQCPHCGKMIF
jgi:hypothetical protein